MIEPAIILVRFLQYLGAAILFGSSLFFVYVLRPSRYPLSAGEHWAGRLIAGAGTVLAGAALLGIAAQASLFAGSWSAGLTAGSMWAVMTSMDLGKAAVVRSIAAILAALSLVMLPPGRARWSIAASLGSIAAISLAWMGHGAGTEGAPGKVHLLSDIIHVLAGAVWIGALAAFAMLSMNRSPSGDHVRALHAALSRFSGIGSLAVATLVVTGSINGLVLVGAEGLREGLGSPYARLLALKLLLFATMLVLAAVNRFHLTPALGSTILDPAGALASLRRSLAVETALGFAILALVAWLGTLEPPQAAF